jgi:hypothetical protein
VRLIKLGGFCRGWEECAPPETMLATDLSGMLDDKEYAYLAVHKCRIIDDLNLLEIMCFKLGFYYYPSCGIVESWISALSPLRIQPL